MKLLDRLTRFDAEGFDEHPAQHAIGFQRLGPAARPVLGEHQPLPQPFPQRQSAHQRRQLGDEDAVLTGRQACVGEVLAGRGRHLLEPHHLGFQPAGPGDVLQRSTAPRRPSVDRRVDVAESPLISRNLTVGVHVPFAGEQIELLLGEIGIDHG